METTEVTSEQISEMEDYVNETANDILQHIAASNWSGSFQGLVMAIVSRIASEAATHVFIGDEPESLLHEGRFEKVNEAAKRSIDGAMQLSRYVRLRAAEHPDAEKYLPESTTPPMN